MQTLTTLDFSIIAFFLIGIFGAGMYMSRRAAGGMEEYLLGGRRLPWYLLGISGMSKWFDVSGTMIITSFLFMLGPQGLFVEFRGGAVLVLAFLLVVAGKWNRRSGCMTEAEWQIFRYGKGRDAEWARFLAALVGIMATIGALGYLIKGAILFLGLFLPFSPANAVFVLVVIVTLYTMFAGFYGVVVTDFVQGVVMLSVAVVIAVLAWMQVGSPAELAATATEVTGNTGWIDFAPAFKVDMPDAYAAYESLIMVMLFYLIRNTMSGVGGGSEPRFFGARSDRECGLQCLLQAFMVMFRWPMMIGIAVMGLYYIQREMPEPEVPARAAEIIHEVHPGLRPTQWRDVISSYANQPHQVEPLLAAQFEELMGEEWPEKLRMIGFNGTVNPELILPAVIKNELPNGLRGLLLVAMIAALMSTFDSALNVAGGLFVRDIYRRWIRPNATEREYIRACYASIPFFVILGAWLGLRAESINDIWGWVVMGLGTGTAAPQILRMIWWRMNGWGVAASLFFGSTAAIVQRFYFPGLNEWFQFLLVSGITFSAAIIVSLLTKPTPPEVVLNFYRKTRSFGWWKPVREQLPPELQDLTRTENWLDIIAIPFVLLAQVTLFLLPMLLVIHHYRGFLQTLPFFVFGALGTWWFWWRPLGNLDKSPE